MDCTTVAANERGDRTGCCCLSSGADLMHNFEIVICVYNWDVSCEDSVYPRYRPFIRIYRISRISEINYFSLVSRDNIQVFDSKLF